MAPRDAGPGERGNKWRLRAPVVLIVAAALSLTLLAFCLSALYVGDTRGSVGIVDDIGAPRESWRVVPAAEVDVLILWRAREAGEYPHSICIRSVLTQTNAQGEYSVDSWWLAPAWPLRQDGLAEIHVFKPGYLPLVDRRLLAQYRAHTHILGPPAVNPWTGLVLPDEGPLKTLDDRGCPDVERL